MKRLLLALALLLTAARAPVRAASACTVTSSTLSQGVLDSVPPAGTLCLTAGSYAPGLMVLRGDGAPRTVQAAPGAVVTWHGVVVIQSPRWTVSGLILDAGGQDLAAVTINTAASGVVLDHNEIRDGAYYGVDVWGSSPLIQGNTIHDFQPPNQVAGNDDQCNNIHGVSDNGILRGNTIYDCWGDGIQFYAPLPTVTNTVTIGWLVANNTFYRGTQAYAENAIDVKGTRGMVISGNTIYGYYNTGYLGTNQPAVVFHGVAANVVFSGNLVRDSAQGVQLSNGLWTNLTIANNTFRNFKDYTLEASAGRQMIVTHNSILNGGAEVIQVASNGWVGGSLDHNVIQASGAPRLYAGATWANVTVGPNAWVGTAPGFLAGLGDVAGVALGFGVPATPTVTASPTATNSPTATATATVTSSPTAIPTATATATASPTASPTATATVSGCWDLRQVPPLPIGCP